MSNLFELSLGQLVSGLGARQFSAVEIAQSFIDRHDAMEERCHAWEIFDRAALLRQAGETDRDLAKGVPARTFEGVPFGIKDIFNTFDFPTQMGSPIWKGFTPGNDARIVYNAKRLGALIPGKTVTAEFAVHALNKTLNPYAPDRTPGTSSSGSAVAVSARMVPVALGTQTAGSVTRPASFCGIYGYKPSFGLLPRTGMLKTTDSLDTIGFFCAHLADVRRVFDGLRVRGDDYPNVKARVDATQDLPRPAKVKVAFIKTHTWDGAAPYVRAAVEKWVSDVARQDGFSVEEVAAPAIMSEAHRTHTTIYDKALAYYFREEFKRKELVSEIMYELIARGNEIGMADYQASLERQVVMAREMDEVLGNYDIFVSLGTSTSAPLRKVVETPDPSLMWTMTYLPTLAVPLFTGPDGLPFALQLGARRYSDYKLLRVAEDLAARKLVPASGFFAK